MVIIIYRKHKYYEWSIRILPTSFRMQSPQKKSFQVSEKTSSWRLFCELKSLLNIDSELTERDLLNATHYIRTLSQEPGKKIILVSPILSRSVVTCAVLLLLLHFFGLIF